MSKRTIWLLMVGAFFVATWQGLNAMRCKDACGVFTVKERVLRTPAQQEAWNEHQQREWEWNKKYANRGFKKCLLKSGYDKCMGRAY